jgi:hypothetical protein
MKERFQSLRDRVRLLSRFGKVTARAYLALARVVVRERLWDVPAREAAR